MPTPSQGYKGQGTGGPLDALLARQQFLIDLTSQETKVSNVKPWQKKPRKRNMVEYVRKSQEIDKTLFFHFGVLSYMISWFGVFWYTFYGWLHGCFWTCSLGWASSITECQLVFSGISLLVQFPGLLPWLEERLPDVLGVCLQGGNDVGFNGGASDKSPFHLAVSVCAFSVKLGLNSFRFWTVWELFASGSFDWVHDLKVLFYLCDHITDASRIQWEWKYVKEVYYQRLTDTRQARAILGTLQRQVITILGIIDDLIVPSYRRPEMLRVTMADASCGDMLWCVKFLHVVCQEGLGRRPEQVRRGVGGGPGIPFFRQFHAVVSLRDTLIAALDLKFDIEGSQSHVVRMEDRHKMVKAQQQIQDRIRLFMRIAGVSVATCITDTELGAKLVEVDRQMACRVRQPSANSASHAQPVSLVSSDNKGAAPCSEKREDNEEEEDDSVCVLCFEHSAEIVFSKCGHLTYCNPCRKKAINHAKGLRRTLSRGYSRFLRQVLVCPICRQDSHTVALSKYDGVVYRC